jgi:hypothetical protein
MEVMKPTNTRGATHLFSAPGNWNPETEGPCGDLEVRAECLGERQVVELISTWKPSHDEITNLMGGGVIEVGICHTTQPPMRMYVVKPIRDGELPMADEAAAINPATAAGFSGRDLAEEMKKERPDIFGLTINEEAHGHE